VAAVLLLISLYFFAQILWSMPGGEVASLAICVAVLRVVELLNDRRSGDVGAQRAATAERNLAELCLHVFVKGWVGALVILVVAQTAWPMAWAYLAWSYGHDLLLRPWLWAKFGPRLTRFAALEPARA
jgi:hypothetical protein